MTSGSKREQYFGGMIISTAISRGDLSSSVPSFTAVAHNYPHPICFIWLSLGLIRLLNVVNGFLVSEHNTHFVGADGGTKPA